MKPWEKFERQIERIHQLIEGTGSKVKWDDHIPDPEDPQELRQIDITVRRDGKLTFIECRFRKRPQDVQWIEGLMGKKLSLKADAVIAVSSSGFAELAKSKATAHGIILRDLHSLTEEEISAWGKTTKVSLIFYQYTNAELLFKVISGKAPADFSNKIYQHLIQNPEKLYGIFQRASEILSDEFKSEAVPPEFFVEMALTPPWFIGECSAGGLRLQSKLRGVRQEISTPAVVLYDAPDKTKEERSISIEKTELENFEIT